MTEFLTAAQAAQRLGVKPATLYAYVSRGVLRRDRAADGRGSLFDSEEVERLARRGRPRRPAGVADITVESAITEITGDRLRYRGLDVIRLATSRTFEDVAELLWTGEFPRSPATRPAPSSPGAQVQPRHPGTTRHPRPGAMAGDARRAGRGPGRAGRAARRDAAARAVPGHRACHGGHRPAAPATGSGGGRRGRAQHHRRPGGLPAPRRLGPIRPSDPGYPARLPGARPAPDTDYPGADYQRTDYPIADRLWPRLCDRRASPLLRRALSAALVLLADHELAASTLAARAAASVRADPYAVVATGMGAVGGALHGGASLGAEAMLAAAAGPDDVPRVVGELLRRGEKVPGFGHFVYRTGDPRAVLLLDLVRRAAPKSGQLAVAEAVLAEVRRKSLPEPNIDFAIATLARVAGMIRGSGEAVFAVARTAGWIAHALEAYAGPGPLRPRAVYTGRPPVAGR